MNVALPYGVESGDAFFRILCKKAQELRYGLCS